MRIEKLALATIACFLHVSCGPSESDIQSELRSVESEMVQLELIAQNLNSRMNRAEFDAFAGGFAAGYGAVADDGYLALKGAGNAIGATIDYDDAYAALQQVRNRYNALASKRYQLRAKLGSR